MKDQRSRHIEFMVLRAVRPTRACTRRGLPATASLRATTRRLMLGVRQSLQLCGERAALEVRVTFLPRLTPRANDRVRRNRSRRREEAEFFEGFAVPCSASPC